MTTARGGGSLGIVETKYYTFAQDHPFATVGGKAISPVTLAYETYGSLNSDKSNAVLVLHALTGDAHAAGQHVRDKGPGWWDNMIGPGKAFDADKYFIICSNVLGGCRGSTVPLAVARRAGGPCSEPISPQWTNMCPLRRCFPGDFQMAIFRDEGAHQPTRV